MAIPIAAAAVVASANILKGIFGNSAAKKQARAQKKAARENYNLIMGNVPLLQKQVDENVDMFKRQADSFRSNQMQKYGLSGIRADLTGVREAGDYELGIDEIDYEGNEDSTKTILRRNPYYDRDSDDPGNKYLSVTKVTKTGEAKDTEKLHGELLDYEGRQVEFENQAQDSMLLNMQKSTQNLQSDMNKVYQQGMKSIMEERQKAEMVLKTGQAQAAATEAAGSASLWSGIFSGISTFASAYQPSNSPSPYNPSYDQKAFTGTYR